MKSYRNLYSLIGFGRKDQIKIFLSNGSNTFLAKDLPTFQSLSDERGTVEDGYAAIQVALNAIKLRPNENILGNIILITDEDRTVQAGFADWTRRRMKKLMKNAYPSVKKWVKLHVIADQNIRVLPGTENGLSWLGNKGALADGWRNTRRDYSSVALEMRGTVFDIKRLKTHIDEAQYGMLFARIADEWLSRNCSKCICGGDGLECTPTYKEACLCREMESLVRQFFVFLFSESWVFALVIPNTLAVRNKDWKCRTLKK